MFRSRPDLPCCLLLGFFSAGAYAADGLHECAKILDDTRRLACYDAIAGRSRADATAAVTPEATALEQRWELRPSLRRGTFVVLPYRPIYALVHATDAVNRRPESPTHPAINQHMDLNSVEAKLQLSLKTKVAQNLFGSEADLWFGYTQASYWQVGNENESSPVRETDYQPEAILVRPLRWDLGGMHFRYVGVTLNHESNGRGESRSRSWNRLIAELALESGQWSLHIRPWRRIFEPAADRNDNPDIEDFVGRGEIVGVYRSGGHTLTLAARHTLKGGEKSRGSGRVDWAFPLVGELKGHLQIFSGYGESLIDYNHRQTTIGLGISFFD